MIKKKSLSNVWQHLREKLVEEKVSDSLANKIKMKSLNENKT